MIEKVESNTVITEEILQELLRFLKEKNYFRRLKVDMYITFCQEYNKDGINTFDIKKYAFEYKKTVGAFLRPVKQFGVAVIEFNEYLQWKSLTKVYNLVKQFENKLLYNEATKHIYFLTKINDYKDDKKINNNKFIIRYNVIYFDFESRAIRNRQTFAEITSFNTSCFGGTLKSTLEKCKIITDEEVKNIINDIKNEFIKSIDDDITDSLNNIKKPFKESKPNNNFIYKSYSYDDVAFYYDSNGLYYTTKTTNY